MGKGATFSLKTVRAILTRIADDEERHAALAWRFIAWAIRQGGQSVANAVHDTAARTMGAALTTPIRPYPGLDVGTWHAHGRLTCQESRAVVQDTIATVLRPCLAQLDAAQERVQAYAPHEHARADVGDNRA